MIARGAQAGLKPFNGLLLAQRGPQSVLRLTGASLRRNLWQRQQGVSASISTLSPRVVFKHVYIIQHSTLASGRLRSFSSTGISRKEAAEANSPNDNTVALSSRDNPEELTLGFERTEKGEAAREVDLSARLRDRGSRSEKGEVFRLLRLAAREWRTLSVAIVLLCISSGVAMSIPFSIGKIIDIATNKIQVTDVFGLSMTQFYVAVGVVLCIGSACNFGRVVLLRIVGERTAALLRSRLYEKTIRQDAAFYDSNRHGELISRLSNDTTVAAKSITQNVSDGLRAVVSGIAGFGMMAYVSLPLTGLMSIIVPPLGILGVFYGRYVRKLSKRTQRALGELTKVSEERLGNVRTAQAFNGEIQEVNRYNKKIRDLFELGKKEGLANGFFFSGYGLAGNTTVLMVLAIGGQMVSAGSITIGQLSSFLLYTIYAGTSISGLSSFYSELMKGVGAASRIFELLDRKPTISSTIGKPISNARGVIKFEHVAFAYPTRPRVSIFSDLSFEVEPGTNVSIVGPSGGGKSTISFFPFYSTDQGSLLLRFYNPTSGRITLNGTDIREYSVKQFRRHISVVPQEPVLFSGTLAENIAYGKPRATRQEILAAARRANCDFVGDFPDGLETEVGPRGAQLSGGQKQRIAIARALIRNPDILILDEATSALDANSEYLVNDALQKVMRSDSTTLTIAHRLATIRRADWIIVLSSDGKVAEQGTYAQLSRKGPDGAFNKLMKMQMEGLAEIPRPNNGVIYEEAEQEEKEEQALKEAEEARLEAEREAAERRKEQGE